MEEGEFSSQFQLPTSNNHPNAANIGGGKNGRCSRIIGSGLKIWRLNFLSITFKLGCCGSKICVADNFNHNKNITLKFAAAAATLVIDQYLINQSKAFISQSLGRDDRAKHFTTRPAKHLLHVLLRAKHLQLNSNTLSYYPWATAPP